MIYVEDNQRNIDSSLEYQIPDDIIKEASIKVFQNGEEIFRTGDPLTYLYIIQRGKVKVYEERFSGDTGRVVILQKGELIGEMEVISNYDKLVYSAKVIKDNTQLLRIPPETFRKWLETDHQFCLKVVRILSDKMHETAFWLNHYTGKSSSAIILNYIYEISREPLKEQEIFRIPETRLEIAENCRLSERTVNRRIRELAKQHIISIVNGKIEITRQQFKKIKGLIENEKDNIGL